MEDLCSQVLEEGLGFFTNAKYRKIDTAEKEILDLTLPSSEQPLLAKTPDISENCTHSPTPPTPPMEEDFLPLVSEKIEDSMQSESEVVITNLSCENCCSSKTVDIDQDCISVTTLNREDELGCKNSPTKDTTESTSLDDSIAQREEVTSAMDYLSVPCLLSIKDLRKKFSKKYNLNFKVSKGSHKEKYLNAYKRKWDLLLKLETWEKALNKSSPNEPYISVENKVDNCGPPEDFVYITQNILPPGIDYLFDKNYLVGCECKRCTPSTCDCSKNSGSDFAYDRIGRVLFEPGKPIYECNSRCFCSISCRNRVVQRGRTVRVTIFRTPNGCGWGVKTMDPILKNQFVTEYVGEVLTSDEAEERGKVYDHVGMTYLFDLDYNDRHAAYTVDAKKFGNISHFINHSCDPNLCVFAVWIETLDPQLPLIAFFATRDIKAGEELTFDYLMTTGESSSSSKSSSQSQLIPCYCGAANCRKYM